jgi:predicted HTH transcriptional regulator
MPITPAQIDIWRESREHACLEFKAARKQFDYDKLCEYCVALANEGGGHMILGIENNPPRAVCGTPAVCDPVDMQEKIFQDVKFRVDIEAVNHPDGRIVVLKCPSRPRGTAFSLKGRYLMRNGSETVSMTEDRLRAIFDEGKPDWLDEHSQTGLNEQEVLALLNTEAFFNLLQQPYPSRVEDVFRKLIGESLIDTDGAFFSIRRLGAILLANRLTDFPDVMRKAPRVIVYHGNSKIGLKTATTGTYGYAVGFSGLVNFVMQHLPKNSVLEDALRRDVKLLPAIVIRGL